MSQWSDDKEFVFLKGAEGLQFLRVMRDKPGFQWADGPIGVGLYSSKGPIAHWVDIEWKEAKSDRLVKDHMLAVDPSTLTIHMVKMMPVMGVAPLKYRTTKAKRR